MQIAPQIRNLKVDIYARLKNKQKNQKKHISVIQNSHIEYFYPKNRKWELNLK